MGNQESQMIHYFVKNYNLALDVFYIAASHIETLLLIEINKTHEIYMLVSTLYCDTCRCKNWWIVKIR